MITMELSQINMFAIGVIGVIALSLLNMSTTKVITAIGLFILSFWFLSRFMNNAEINLLTASCLSAVGVLFYNHYLDRDIYVSLLILFLAMLGLFIFLFHLSGYGLYTNDSYDSVNSFQQELIYTFKKIETVLK